MDHEPYAPPGAQTTADVRRRLDQVVRRVRALRLLAGVARLVALVVVVSLACYVADRLLDLPVAVRGLALLVLVGFLGRELWTRVLVPLRGLDRLDAARLVEERAPELEGRLVAALQLEPGAPGSFSHKVLEEASASCAQDDLRRVLDPSRPWRETARAAGAAVALVILVVLAQPELDIFARRWLLQDVAWPRDTRLALHVAERGPAHVRLDDGSLVVARGGVLNIQASFEGKRPERVELVLEGDDGTRVQPMTSGAQERFHGHVTIAAEDARLFVRGGDDDGDETVLELAVIEPPRLIEPRFELQPPAYLGEPGEVVGPEGLAVSEGTRITVRGRPTGEPDSGRLLLLGQVEPVPLELRRDDGGLLVEGSFVATESDTLRVELSGAHGLAAPDPSRHALLVHRDHPPALRIYAPARSDVKVTPRAVVPFAVVAEDDHGVAAVNLDPRDGEPVPFVGGDVRPEEHRLVLDVEALGLQGTLTYAIEASDRRDLPGKGPQTARVDGRRVDVVEESEVQRLLADRQLRLKEAFGAIRERQLRATESVDDLIAEPPAADDPDLVAAAVAQNQVSMRLAREGRELCAILDETILNRLDPGPGAPAVLERRLADWAARPVDEAFAPEAWRQLAADYGEGRFGRLDHVGRLLDMAAVALELSGDLSPAAHDRLTEARHDPSADRLAQARDAQAAVQAGLDRLLDRMDEWEDYQEVLSLVQTLIEEQQALRVRTRESLGKEP